MQNYKFLIGSLLSLSASALLADQPAAPSQPQSTTQPRGVITPAVAPRVSNGAGVVISADFIWWRPHVDGMEWATTGINDGGNNVPNFTNVSRGRTYQPDFDFKPGFKVGLGLDFAHDGWDLLAEYTWLFGGNQTNSFNSKPGLGAITALPLVDGAGGNFVNNVQSGSSQWRQHFNVVDLTLGRNFFISRYLTLRPSVGLKGAWITEKLNLNFSAINLPNSNLNTATQYRKQNMWGVGARFGLDGVWHFCKNWGLYGDVAVTAQWSDFHVKAKDVTNTFVSPSQPSVTSTNLNTRETILNVIPVVEAGVGLTYMTWFHNDDYQFQFMAGWEEQIWVNFNHMMDPDRSGNLALEGLTVKLGFAF